MAAAGLASTLDPLTHALAEPSPRQRDLIKIENEKSGTTDWLLRNTRVDPKTKYRCPWIEGYCSRTSLRAGQTLEIMVSTNPASPFAIDIYRLSGAEGELRLQRGDLLVGRRSERTAGLQAPGLLWCPAKGARPEGAANHEQPVQPLSRQGLRDHPEVTGSKCATAHRRVAHS